MNNLLFIDHNAGLSLIAAAFASKKAPNDLTVTTAYLKESRLPQELLQVMQEENIDLSNSPNQHLPALANQSFDIVITFNQSTFDASPIFPDKPPVINWNLPLTNNQSTKKQNTTDYYRQLREQIKHEVDNFFDNGYYNAFIASKTDSKLVLDNISDAVIAHDLNRNIFYFNKAAERVTGYNREAVLNKDCHQVFGTPICGEQCQFCTPSPNLPKTSRRTIQLTDKSNQQHICEMTTTLMYDRNNTPKGILAVMRDLSSMQNLAKYATRTEHFNGIIGTSPEIQEVLEAISDIADSSAPVLITGESGTGKELAARAIHQQSSRKNKLFVPINCGALPENLLESELFGHVKGAFTGALRDKKGRFELAANGTIFLDEIGDISPAMQVKLLRVLQEGTFERVGGEKTIKVNVRVISATNKDLNTEMNEGRFREDLFYRLNVIPLTLPPLRSRGSDVVILAEYLLAKASKHGNKNKINFSSTVIDTFLKYQWPGNIRELENWIQYAVLKCKGDVIEPIHLPNFATTVVQTNFSNKKATLPKRRKRKLDPEQVKQALTQANGNKKKTAQLLGVGRATLYRFLAEQQKS
jgi:PAS domain S-box-containing protein